MDVRDKKILSQLHDAGSFVMRVGRTSLGTWYPTKMWRVQDIRTLSRTKLVSQQNPTCTMCSTPKRRIWNIATATVVYGKKQRTGG